MNIYLVRQNTSHLYGPVFSTAVVIASSINTAKQTLTTYLKSSLEPVVYNTDLWATIKIGNNGKAPAHAPKEPIVVCVHIEEKQGLPAGDYTPHVRF